MVKNISILGSTGSIGTQTLEVVRYNKDIKVTALAAGSNVDLIEKQIREFKPEIACLWSEEKAKELKERVKDLDVKILSGMEGLIVVATEPKAEIVVTAVVGMIGIRPTIAAMEAGKDIALANKETLVTAGHIIMPLAKKMGVKILPVDSEHSAIFQCLQGAAGNKIHKILLTASGGPFRGWKREQLEKVQVEDALKHPRSEAVSLPWSRWQDCAFRLHLSQTTAFLWMLPLKQRKVPVWKLPAPALKQPLIPEYPAPSHILPSQSYCTTEPEAAETYISIFFFSYLPLLQIFCNLFL